MDQRPDIRLAASRKGFRHSGNRGTNLQFVIAAVSCAYQFLFRQFWPALKLTWLPFALAGVSLYFSLSDYLAELLAFLATPDPRVAARALGVLAAGAFFVMFCYTIAAVAIAELASGQTLRSGWFHLRTRRREWLLYAAYLRFLLFLVLLIGGLSFVSAASAPVLGISLDLTAAVTLWLGVAGACWFFARAGFLLAPMASKGEAVSLRRTWTCSSENFWKLAAVIFALLLPGLVVQSIGEFVLRDWGSIPFDADKIPLAEYAQFVARTLPAWLAVFTLSSFVTLVLLTAGAVSVSDRLGRAPRASAERPAPDADGAAKATGTLSAVR